MTILCPRCGCQFDQPALLQDAIPPEWEPVFATLARLPRYEADATDISDLMDFLESLPLSPTQAARAAVAYAAHYGDSPRHTYGNVINGYKLWAMQEREYQAAQRQSQNGSNDKYLADYRRLHGGYAPGDEAKP